MDSRKEVDYDYNQPVDVETNDQTDEEKKEFVDAAVATPVFIFLLECLGKAIVTFFTMRFLENWWNKRNKTADPEKKESEPGE